MAVTAGSQSKDTLDEQTAIAELLRVVSVDAPGNVNVAFDAVISTALRISDGICAAILLFTGDRIALAALTDLRGAQFQAHWRSAFPLALDSATIAALKKTAGLTIGNVLLPTFTMDTRYAPARDVPNASAIGADGSLAVVIGDRLRAAGLNLVGSPTVRLMLATGEAMPIGALIVLRTSDAALTATQAASLATLAHAAEIAFEIDRLRREEKRLLGQQRAASKVLQVIAESRTDIQPVFDSIASAAMRFFEFDVFAVAVTLARENRIELAAMAADMSMQASWRSFFPLPLDRGSVTGRAILEKATQNVSDQDGSMVPELERGIGQRVKVRSVVAAPMVRDGTGVGAIVLFRAMPGRFTEDQIALLSTFADQAVIAIENVRLFNETKDALEQQTAIAEVLRVISNSPDDVQPILDAVVGKARNLTKSLCAGIVLLRNSQLNLVALTTGAPEVEGRVRTALATREDGLVYQEEAILDFEHQSKIDLEQIVVGRLQRSFPESVDELAMRAIVRSSNVAPVGALIVFPAKGQSFSVKHKALLTMLAHQIELAIEKIELFKNTKQSLEQQTAASQILRVIAATHTDVQPVFDAITARAVELFAFDILAAAIVLVRGSRIELAALKTRLPPDADARWRDLFPMGLDAESVTARALRGTSMGQAFRQKIAHSIDHREAPTALEFNDTPDGFKRAGSVLLAPMIHDGKAIGALVLFRAMVGKPYYLAQAETMVKTFADQAVIAIENVRLFKELEARNKDLGESLEQQTATSEVLQAISTSRDDMGPVLGIVASTARRLLNGVCAVIVSVKNQQFELNAVADNRGRQYEAEISTLFPAPVRSVESIAPSAVTNEHARGPGGLMFGALWDRLATMFPDATYSAATRLFVLPGGAAPIGALLVFHTVPAELTARQKNVLTSLAHQAEIAIENVRLFNEIQEKTHQLEVANKHKSDFLAHMSHELRTPLNAVIGFSEALMDKMFGDVNEKQLDYLKDIHESGKHLLSLINDILDLSKIEAGRMDLELSTFHLPTAISNALVLVRERAMRHGVQLASDVDSRLADFQADERKVKQVLLNLLSNAVKFTPEGGRVDVTAKLDTACVEIAVRDTGGGISAEDQASLFEEFRQVGKDSARKAEGTGLGLALTKRFVELHGGHIRVESAIGNGSTFAFTLPLRH